MNTLKFWYPIPEKLLFTNLQESISQQVIDIVSINCGKEITIDGSVFHMLENTHGDMTICHESTEVIMPLWQCQEFVFFLSLVRWADALWQLEQALFPEDKQALLLWMQERDTQKHEYTVRDFWDRGMYETIPQWWRISTMMLNRGWHWNNEFYQVHVDRGTQEIVFSFWGKWMIGFLNTQQEQKPKEQIRISIAKVSVYIQALFVSAEKYLWRTNPWKYRGVLEYLFSESYRGEFGREGIEN